MADVIVGWVTQLGENWVANLAPAFGTLEGCRVFQDQNLAKQKVQAATTFQARWAQDNAPTEPLRLRYYYSTGGPA